MKKLVLFLLLLTACGGVASPQSEPTSNSPYIEGRYACENYTLAFQRVNFQYGGVDPAEVYKAVDAWNEALGPRITLLDSPSNDNNPYKDPEKAKTHIFVEADPDLEVAGNIIFRNYVGPCSCWIRMAPGAVWQEIAHEIGHCLGLNHTTENGSIMEAFVDIGAYITQENVDLVLEHTNLNDPLEVK